MTCFPLPSHDVLTNHNCQCQSVSLSVRGRKRKKKGKRKLKAGVWTESLMFPSVSTSYIHPLTRTSHAHKAVTACKPPPNFPLSVLMRRAGVKSQNSHRPFPCTVCTFKHPNKKCCWLQAKKHHTEKHGAICPTLALLPTCISRCAANQPGRAPFLTASTSSTCSAGQTRGLNSLCHSANLLGSWSAMPLDPCASVQRHLSTRADWQRLTRRSGPGATAQTKLVRLGRGPLVLNPSVGRRFSVPRSVAV